MTKGYTTEALIEAELGTSITESTTPTSTQIAQWILEAEDAIDSRTQTSFTTATATDEIYPWNEDISYNKPTVGSWNGYSGRIDYGLMSVRNSFTLKNRPLISITSLYLNGAGESGTDAWTQYTENTGSGGSFIKNTDESAITFISAHPRYGERSIKVTYTYGYAAIPERVKTLATKMVVRRIIDMKVKKSAFSTTDSVTLGSLAVRKELNQDVTLIKQLDSEIEELFKQIGEMYSKVV